MGGDAAIRTSELTKRYGDVTAVDGLSLEVQEGEVFGFLGPNGAGKSTTINMLLDYARPTSGSAEVLGHDPQADPRAVRSRTGILPEGYDLYDRLTGRKHLEYAVELNGANDDPDALLRRVGLADAADRPAGDYSKGMAQRLALAMALVGEPELLILDEPTTGLDPAGAREMREVVRAERDRGATVFFSSHVMEQVEAVCDRVGILDGGDVVAVDTIEGLRETAGGGSTLVLTLSDPGADPDLSGVEGVGGVERDGRRLRVACPDPAAKADVVAAVQGSGVEVADVGVEETSLEDLFVAYTGGGAGASA